MYFYFYALITLITKKKRKCKVKFCPQCLCLTWFYMVLPAMYTGGKIKCCLFTTLPHFSVTSVKLTEKIFKMSFKINGFKIL